jgi:hypothetical protein
MCSETGRDLCSCAIGFCCWGSLRSLISIMDLRELDGEHASEAGGTGAGSCPIASTFMRRVETSVHVCVCQR